MIVLLASWFNQPVTQGTLLEFAFAFYIGHFLVEQLWAELRHRRRMRGQR